MKGPLNNSPPHMLDPNDPGIAAEGSCFGLGSRANNARVVAALMRAHGVVPTDESFKARVDLVQALRECRPEVAKARLSKKESA